MKTEGRKHLSRKKLLWVFGIVERCAKSVLMWITKWLSKNLRYVILSIAKDPSRMRVGGVEPPTKPETSSEILRKEGTVSTPAPQNDTKNVSQRSCNSTWNTRVLVAGAAAIALVLTFFITFAPAEAQDQPTGTGFTPATAGTQDDNPCAKFGLQDSWGNPVEKVACSGAKFFIAKILSSISEITCNLSGSAISANYDNKATATYSNGRCIIVQNGNSALTDILAGKSSQTGNKAPNGAWVQTLYKLCRNFLNVFLVILLILFAFFNILHYNIDNYAIKKMLPKVLATAVAANLALPIFAIASKFTDSIQTVSIFRPHAIGDLFYILKGMSPTAGGSITGIIAIIGTAVVGAVSGIGCCVGIVLFLASVVIMILLNLILAFRPYIIMLGAAISPIAIACSILPQTQQFFKKWLGIVIPWMFMPIVIWAIINIGDLIPGQMGVSDTGVISSIIGFILPALIRIGLLILAVRFPFMIEKDISGLVQLAGKYTGQGAVLGGAWAGEKIYTRQKKHEQEIASKATEEASRYQPPPEDIQAKVQENQQKGKYIRLTTQEQEEKAAEELRREKAYQLTRDRIYGGHGERGYWKHPGRRLLRGIGAIASMPLGVFEGYKKNHEIMALERSKQAQKLFFAELPKWSPFGIELGFGSAVVRGELGDLRYYEENIKDDLKRNLSVEDIADYISQDLFDKVKANVNGRGGINPNLTDDQAWQYIYNIMNRLYTDAENVGTWASDPIFRGLAQVDAAKLKVGYGRMREQAVRTYRLGGRSRVHEDAEIAILSAMKGVPSGAPSGAPTGAPSGTVGIDHPGHRVDNTEQEVELLKQRDARAQGAGANQAVEEYLAEISRGIEKLGNGDGLSRALSRAKLNATIAQGYNSFERSSDTTMQGLSARLSELGIDNNKIKRLVYYMKSMGVFDLKKLPELMARAGLDSNESNLIFNDQQANRLINGQRGNRYGLYGALASTEPAQLTQREAATLSGKLRAENVQGIESDCERIMMHSIDPTFQISPQEVSNSLGRLKAYLPAGAISKSRAQNGELLYQVASPEAVRQLSRSVEASTIHLPSGQVRVIQDPTEIAYRTGIQIERDISIDSVGEISGQIKNALASNQPIGQDIQAALNATIAKIASSHFELRSGERWKGMTDEIHSRVIEAARQRLVLDINGSQNPQQANQAAQTNVVGYLEEELQRIGS